MTDEPEVPTTDDGDGSEVPLSVKDASPILAKDDGKVVIAEPQQETA